MPLKPSRRAAGAAAHSVGLLVVEEFLGGGIEAQFAPELPADGGGVAGDVAVARDHLDSPPVCRGI